MSDSRSFEDRVFARFDAIDAWRDSVDARFDAVDARLDRLDARVEALEIQSEKRALETKPIWERALAEILEVKELVEDVERKIDILSRDIVKVRADQVRLDDRLDKLDSKRV